MRKTVRITITVPREVLLAVEDKRKLVPRSTFISRILARSLNLQVYPEE